MTRVPDPLTGWLSIAATVLVCTAVCVIAWTGFLGSDDDFYLAAALGWLHQFPYVGNHVGLLRPTISLPIAGSIALLGDNEFALVAPTCLYLVGVVLVTRHFLLEPLGTWPATAAAMLLATLPLLALKSTVAGADTPELFFIALSIWLFVKSAERDTKTVTLFLSGVFAAFAYLAHEQVLALLIFYGIAFLAGYHVPRRFYFVMGAGFLTIYAGECLYYALTTGNPLYRLVTLTTAVGGPGDRVFVDRFQIAAGGTIHVWAPIDPLLMLFTKHDFGVLAFVALPALRWAFRPDGTPADASRRTARLFTFLGVVWLIAMAILLRKIILLPRYYLVTAYCLAIVVALWLTHWMHPRRPRAVAWIIGLLLLVNLGGLLVDNKDPRFAERSLIAYLESTQGPIRTDAMTRHRVDTLCRWTTADCGRLKTGAPEPGDTVFRNPAHVDRPNRLVSADQVRRYALAEGWKEVWHREQTPNPALRLLRASGVERFAPEPLRRKLAAPAPAVRVYRVNDSQ